MSKFTYKEFSRLLLTAKYQFTLKTNDSIYFITPKDYNSFNVSGFVARNESNGYIEILSYSDIIEVTVDSKKYNYN